MQPDLLRRYAAPVPRYTSYPTAPHFHDGVTGETYSGWLEAQDGKAPLSLYLHVPFCDRLCWYCGCHTKQTRRYQPVADYVNALLQEISLVAARLPKRARISAIHFGGGSPTIVSPADLSRIRHALDRHFNMDPAAEISVEIDPGYVDAERLSAWRDIGMTRASIGVQDFDPAVQQAINRPQTFEQTQRILHLLRTYGVGGINLDVVYGLPHQTIESLGRTLELSLSMAPDRFAIFGYAHVPWMKKHQTLIDETALAGIETRFEMQQMIAQRLLAAGYLSIGIDHFARPGDSLAAALDQKEVKRNFQGYTTDQAPALIGLGASAIGRTEGGYVQNIVATGEYMRAVSEGRLPIAKGFALGPVDRAIGEAIESLMCHFAFSVRRLKERYGAAAEVVQASAARIHQQDPDGITRFDGDHFEVLPQGQIFVRTIAAGFDQYFGRGTARHSVAV
ncbi:oxygen-independent coproporphyrinogen III oxidase [Rhizobium sp. SSA_523]|uniref:oxygen-independent coproporphyrinogen III oxidase n=1 Tax=Rhizobium sp. SSA_523 TaxID=2952477 RepID=UPI002090EEFA|nr:oxygen-independent coproporphyrinogen III oxidase [Rhizobium sp. SSA_523]MCO5732586.1 oxygen-independent coproporphyrinogen III oxidase [Rhizobium sp. SSA_523]WKC23775.1 oxygen-independent coproporphyrinogen III oxidase [Rhizobium sp. SSA_523]